MLKHLLISGVASVAMVASASAPAWGTEPTWWTQQKIECGIDLDVAYNDWVAAGSPCPRQTGQSTAPNTTSSVAGDLGTATVMSLMGGDMRGAALSGGLLLGLGLLTAGNQTPEQAAAQRRAQELAIAQEAARRQAAYEQEQREEAARIERNRQLVASLRGSVDETELSMRGLDSSQPLQLRSLPGDAATTEVSANANAFYGAPTTAEQSPEYVIINQMRAHAAALGWSEEEQLRLERTLVGLQEDTYEHTPHVVDILWRRIREHGTDPAVLASAAAGQGPDLDQSGWQSGRYSDCVLFAIATASGTPYGAVSARAAELVHNAEWRTAAERANPLSVFSNSSGGLNGGETVMLAETFGQAAPVPFAQFESTVRSGRPVMVSLATVGGGTRGKHQVVISRTFQHDGETWFEFIDSQTRGINQRSRVRAYELERLITEAGVTITPGDAVPMLRSN